MQTPKKLTAKQQARARRLRKRRLRRIGWRIALSVLTVIALVLIGALSAGYAAFKGPSQSMGDLLTVTMLETSALKFVPRIYYSQEEVDRIVARNSLSVGDAETDTSLIVIEKPTPTPEPMTEMDVVVDATPSPTPPPENLLVSEDGIDIFDITGGTYRGYMMVVHDPSRVSVGICRDRFSSKSGLQLKEIAARYDAVAAINGGGFEDHSGMGNGGMPIGLVVSQGELKHRQEENKYDVTVGFNQDDIMIIDEKMTAEEAAQKGIRDAITFGPALIVNGEPASVTGLSSGLNPRSAVGQRADGAVLMLVIDGRQASSLGATYSDLISIMMEYGAVNAINMDGGSSSLLYYRGKYVNQGVVLTGSRDMPTAFIVR